MAVDFWVWAAFLAGVVVLLVLDLTVVHRQPHAVSVKEAAIWTTVWIALGLAFGVGIWHFAGRGLNFS